jgi:hypothetical protein
MGTNDLVVGEERAICHEVEGRHSSRNHALAIHHSVRCLSGYLQNPRTPPRPAGFLALAACSCRPARAFCATVVVPSNWEHKRSIGMRPFVLEKTQVKRVALLPSEVIKGARSTRTTTVSGHKRHSTENPRLGLIVYSSGMKWKGKPSHLTGKPSSEAKTKRLTTPGNSGDVRHLGEDSWHL